MKHSAVAPRGVLRPAFGAAAFVGSLVGVVLLAGGLCGCKTAATGAQPAIAYMAPEWESLNIKTLAFLGVGSSAGDEDARIAAEDLAEQFLLSSQDRFVILGLNTSQERAAAAGAADLFGRAVKGWHDQRIMDQFVAQELCRKLAVDGLLLGDLTDWRRERVEFTEQGSSYTQIALGLSIVSAKTGLEVWSAEKMIRRDSAAYAPASGGSGVYTDESGISRAQRAGSMTPEPPRPEEVMEAVMGSLVAAFPPAPPSP
jgi:hypothetical protein